MRLHNSSVSLPAVGAILDTEDEIKKLLYVVLASTELQSLKALQAALCTNTNRSTLALSADGLPTYAVGSARKKYDILTRRLGEHVRGYVSIMLHPLVYKPTDTGCYILQNEHPIERMLVTTLDRLLVWPVLPQWGDYLLTTGRERRLVRRLTSINAPDGYFISNADAWGDLISTGLQNRAISF